MNKLLDYKTCELVEELKTRIGVQEQLADPHEELKLAVEGPAIVLIITD